MEERKEKCIQQRSKSFLNTAAFVVFSFVPYSLIYISMTAAEDILAGTSIPTSVVYLYGTAHTFSELWCYQFSRIKSHIC